MTTHQPIEHGHIDVYPIGDGIAARLRRLRLRLAGAIPPGDTSHHRRTPDRWHRRWQAEHTGDHANLGATRRWTRTGAFIAHGVKVNRARDPHPRRTAWAELRQRLAR